MSNNPENLILHVDGDSFFVSCEVSEHPEYIGKPVIVGEDRGIAVAMSYEAKKLGVTRGMPIFRIKKEFPQVIILSHHFDLYNRISKGVYDILVSYLEQVEQYSIDECFAVVKPSDVRFAGSAKKLATDIQNEIKKSFGVTYSLGLARTKVLAKTASKLEKPNGLVLLLNNKDEEDALKRTSIDDVWGIGRQTVPRLINMGIKTAYDFTRYPSEQIRKYFAEPVYIIQRELLGESINEVNSDSDPRDQKSIQSTATFKPSSSDSKIIFAELSENVERACERARQIELMTNSVSFFVKNTDFIYHSGESKLPLYTNNPSVILNTIENSFKKILNSNEKIRATGITLQNLRRSEDVPKDLFGIQEKANKKDIIEEVGDKIKEKFGQNALKRASSLKGSGRKRGNSFPKSQ
jgi:DNA polymerase-4/DNA polymerase V